MSAEVINNLSNLSFKLKDIKIKKQYCEKELNDIPAQKQELEAKFKFYELSEATYRKAVDIIYQASLGELEDTINSALSYIFFDSNYEIKFELADKRGKSLTMKIFDNGEEVSLKRGMGMGQCCVISAILHTYYLNTKNSKVLFLDEAYSNIYEDYIPRFFEFLGRLCEKLQFKIVLISHDPRFQYYAKKLYEVRNGKVRITRDANADTTV